LAELNAISPYWDDPGQQAALAAISSQIDELRPIVQKILDVGQSDQNNLPLNLFHVNVQPIAQDLDAAMETMVTALGQAAPSPERLALVARMGEMRVHFTAALGHLQRNLTDGEAESRRHFRDSWQRFTNLQR